MTIKSRENLVHVFLIITIVILALSSLSLWLISPEPLSSQSRAHPGGILGFWMNIVSAFVCGFTGMLVLVTLALRTGKSSSIELFFLSVWAFGLNLELGSAFIPWFISQGFGLFTIGLISRVIIFGRYISLLSLFLGSIFALGLQQDRLDFIFGIIFLLAAFFASLHPLNMIARSAGFVELDYSDMVKNFETIIILMGFINYLVAWWEKKDRAFLAAGLGAVAFTTSVYILRSNPGPLLYILIVPLIVTGIWLYIKSLYSHYLWR